MPVPLVYELLYPALSPAARPTVIGVTAPVEATADRVRAAVPDVSSQRLDNLLYLCQGHFLGRLLGPLFLNDLMPSPEGATLGPVPDSAQRLVARRPLTQAECKVVDYVIERYGVLTEEALASAVRDTQPWQEAASGGWLIAPEVMRDEFSPRTGMQG